VTSKNYKEQIPVIVATLKELVQDKLSKDSKTDDLEELLEELEEEQEDYDDEALDKTAKDTKTAKDEDTESDDTEEMSSDKKTAKDEKKPEKVEPKKEKGVMPEKIDVPQAMDAATLKKELQAEIASKFQAAKEVNPFIGEIDVYGMDSAASIYRLALDQAGVKTEGITETAALRAMVGMLATEKPQTQLPVAMDSAAIDSYHATYTKIPSKI
jgi:hypothetical protein